MSNYEIFEEIFENACEMLDSSGWVVFDGEYFDEVENQICERFGVTDPTEIEGYTEWYNEMAMEL